MSFGLTEITIQKIQSVLSLFPEIEEAILYGSRAKGNYKNGSDIDLTFKGPLLNHKLVNQISLKLDDLDLPYTFDLSDYDKIENTNLVEHIQRVGVVFYKR